MRYDGLHLAVRADGARVVEVACRSAGNPTSATTSCALRRSARATAAAARMKPGPQQQVLRRVAGHGELGEEHEIGAGVARLVEAGEDQLAVPVEVADDGVDLGEREPHGLRLTVENPRRS